MYASRVIRAAAFFLALYAPLAHSLVIDPFYSGSYSASSLGSVPGLPANYGGLTFLDNNTILIGGQANTSAGRLYTIDVVRGAGNHITGFSGTASLYGGTGSGIGDFNDGGVVFGPNGVLFLARWNVNQIGQVTPGSTDENKITAGPAGAISSVSALNFVPSGFGGAGNLKVVTWVGGQWYDTGIPAPDGSGTFNIGPFTQIDVDPVSGGTQNVPGGPEGFVYIAAGNPLFPVNSMLIAEFSAGEVGAYEVDANGNPLVNTRRDFVTGLSGAEGAAIDPLTGDFLFSTFGGGNQIAVVQGFLAPPPPNGHASEPATVALSGIAILALALLRRRGPSRLRRQE